MKKIWLSLSVTLFWVLSVLFYNTQATPGMSGGGSVGTGGATGLTAAIKAENHMWETAAIFLMLIIFLLVLLIIKDKRDQQNASKPPPPPPPSKFVSPVPTSGFYAPPNTNIEGNTKPSTWNGNEWGFVGETKLEGTNNTVVASRTPGQSYITVTDSSTYINGKLVPPGNYYLVKGNTVNTGGHSITF